MKACLGLASGAGGGCEGQLSPETWREGDGEELGKMTHISLLQTQLRSPCEDLTLVHYKNKDVWPSEKPTLRLSGILLSSQNLISP